MFPFEGATMTESDMMNLAANGDQLAVAELFEANLEPVTKWAAIYLTRGDRDAADDVAQEAFIRAFVAIDRGQYTPGESFRCWVQTIARNVAIDKSRKRSERFARSMVRESHDDTDWLPSVAGRESDPAYIVEDRERVAHQTEYANAFVEDLNDEQAVTLLDYLGGMSLPEIASSCGIPLPTAKSRLRLAREKLAGCFS